jgi:2-keto-4-pentenoate hydratase/2-oxohepta-3-ene-1,7-dioic acid hydratase in catechol pathway
VEAVVIVARLVHEGRPRWVRVEGDRYRLLSSPTPWSDPAIEATAHPFDPARLLEPAVPVKILAAGLNYTDHAAEMGMSRPQDPVIFMKPVSALLPPGGTIVRPRASTRVDYEAELAVVLRDRLRDASVEEAQAAIWGYTCCNDVTARDLQKRDGQWTRAKGFDTFCPLGPWLVTDFVEKGQEILCLVNGEVRQRSRLSNMMWRTAELLAFISGVMPLEPLDVVTTGTPAGIGPLAAGDEVVVSIEGIGELRNKVR